MMRTGTLRLLVLLFAPFFLMLSWGAWAQDSETLTPTPLPQGEGLTPAPIDVTLLPPPY
jgi:hypothetical protein